MGMSCRSFMRWMVRTYCVCTPNSLEFFHVTSRSILISSTSSGCRWNLARSLNSVKFIISPTSCLSPGSWHEPTAGALSSIFPSSTRTSPSKEVICKTTTETTRSMSPLAFIRTHDLPLMTSSCKSALPWKLPLWSSAERPMVTCTLVSMETTRSLSSVKGTSRSVGQGACGGRAATMRRWKCSQYSAVTSVTGPCFCSTSIMASLEMDSTWEWVCAVALPTWTQWAQSAASQIHWPTSTDVACAQCTGAVAGSWT
mmetsp:Transcript_46612/g.134940  ORF Transcript_46612/g.134940 Transcript_46612/m.134940 type:complete len:256 (-) Transcript_46612:149-916(-)